MRGGSKIRPLSGIDPPHPDPLPLERAFFNGIVAVASRHHLLRAGVSLGSDGHLFTQILARAFAMAAYLGTDSTVLMVTSPPFTLIGTQAARRCASINLAFNHCQV